MPVTGSVAALWRYPVKSMLGEQLSEAEVSERGLYGDRTHAVVDATTGQVGSAKQPRLWKRLLACTAVGAGDHVRLWLADGEQVAASDPRVDERLTALLGRPVTLEGTPPAGPELQRAVPEDVLRLGLDAEVETVTLELGQAAPPGTFFDYAPVHVMTRATLDRIAALHPRGVSDVRRYRPNVVLDLPEEEGFAENAWADRTIALGPDVVLKVLLPTPRCAIPTLAHGDAAPDPDALRVLNAHNRIDLAEFGEAACAGAYARVLQGGRVRASDRASLS